MEHTIKLELTVNMSCPEDMTLEKAAELAMLHVQNCIADNPDADGSEITEVDVTIKNKNK